MRDERQVFIALPLHAPKLGDVSKYDNRQRDVPFVVLHARTPRQEVAPLAVPSDAKHLVVRELLALQCAHERALLARESSTLEVLRLQRLERVQGAQIVVPKAENGPRGVVHHPQVTAPVADGDAFAQVLEKRVELRTVPRLGFRVLLLSDTAQEEVLVESAIEIVLLELRTASRDRALHAPEDHVVLQRLDEGVRPGERRIG